MAPTRLFLLASLLAFFAVGSALAQTEESAADAPPERESSIVEIEAPPAAAAWRGDIGTLRIGIADGTDPRGAVRRLDLFRESLEEKLDLPVEIVPFGDFLTLSDAQAAGRVEYAVHSALSFALTSASCNCVEPLAVPTFAGGAKGIRVVVIATSSSAPGVTSSSLSTFGVVGNVDENEHLDLARSLLEQEGRPALFAQDVTGFADFASAATALASGEIAGIVGWSTLTGTLAEGYSHGTLRDLLQTGLVTSADLELAWQSPEIRLGPHAIRRNLPAELKGLLQGHLLSLEGSEPAAYDSVAPRLGGGFRAAQLADYNELKALIVAPDAQTAPGTSPQLPEDVTTPQ